MDIILVHLGKSMPSHILTCLEQIRRFTKDRIIIVLSEMSVVHFDPSDDIFMVSVETMNKSENWKRFKEIGYFETKKYNKIDLWKYACERFYAIEMVMNQFKIDKALHIENDNLIYAKPDESFFESYCGKSIGLPKISEVYLSAGIMYIGSIEYLNTLNKRLNSLMENGEKELNKIYGKEMMNEMRMLEIIHGENPDLIELLPVLPSKKSRYVYDCASWGQYVGGVFGHNGDPYTSDTHIIGRKINQKRYDVEWKIENGYKTPYVIDKETKQMQPLYNLHIHIKDLERWVS